jgi:biopolymer transport protein ExbB
MSFRVIDICNDCGSGNRPVNFVLFLMALAALSILVERFRAFRASSALDAMRAIGSMARREGASARERRFLLARVARSIRHEHGRGLGSLLTVAITAPLVGVLGTLSGCIAVCRGMALTGSVSPGAASAGLAAALQPLAYALLVGIPSLWAHTYFCERRERVSLAIERALLAGDLD